MINYISKKIIEIIIVIFLGIQILIYFFNQKPLNENFIQKTITVENFSSIVLSNSGITKIGSKKLNKLGIKHKSLFIEKEGHGYFDEEVRYESNMQLINFFKEHLN